MREVGSRVDSNINTGEMNYILTEIREIERFRLNSHYRLLFDFECLSFSILRGVRRTKKRIHWITMQLCMERNSKICKNSLLWNPVFSDIIFCLVIVLVVGQYLINIILRMSHKVLQVKGRTMSNPTQHWTNSHDHDIKTCWKQTFMVPLTAVTNESNTIYILAGSGLACMTVAVGMSGVRWQGLMDVITSNNNDWIKHNIYSKHYQCVKMAHL